MPTNGLRLFRLFGVTVWLHWSWALAATYILWERSDQYGSQLWNAAEYLALFAIVLLHEFGHALACRSVGGQADRIVLWPLGGVAFVRPPPRPGPYLWSIAAGPLVNVALLLPLWPFLFGSPVTDLGRALHNVAVLNAVLLAFNLLPVYPLDGGKILQSLLWFVIGRANGLTVAAGVGLVGAVGLGVLAYEYETPFGGVMAVFVLVQAWNGWRQARLIRGQARESRGRSALRRRPEWACPACRAHPPVGPHWVCPACKQRVDAFDGFADCTHCGRPNESAVCPDCGIRSSYARWTPNAFPVIVAPAAAGTPRQPPVLSPGDQWGLRPPKFNPGPDDPFRPS